MNMIRAGLVFLSLAGPLRGRASAAEAPASPAPWIPRDAVAMETYRGKDFKIVAYQYRIEFFPKKAKKPAVVLTFKHPVTVSPASADWGKDSRGNILACTDRFMAYSIQDPEEQRLAAGGDGAETQMRWEDPKARFPDFCGVIGPDGTVVFQLPREKFPERLYQPAGIAGNGERAAFLVGPYGRLEDPDQDSETGEGLNAKEIWIWEHPGTLRKRKMTEKDRTVFLLGELRAGRL